MEHTDTEMTKMEAIVALLDLGRTADERTCRAAMLGAKALTRYLKHRAANHASRRERGLPASHAPETPPTPNASRAPARNFDEFATPSFVLTEGKSPDGTAERARNHCGDWEKGQKRHE